MHLRTVIGATALYSIFAGYFAYAGGGRSIVFIFCMAPYLFSLWTLIFTVPASARAGFSIGATAMLALFGTLIISSNDPKAGQLWWFHLFSVPIAAIGTGLAGNYFIKWLNIKAELASSAVITFLVGMLPFALITFSA